MEVRRRPHDDAPAREALAHVVVRVARQVEREALRRKGPEGLARRAVKRDSDRVVGQARCTVPLHDLVRDHRADRTVSVLHRSRDRDGLAALDRAGEAGQERMVEILLKLMVLSERVADGARLGARTVKDAGEIHALRLPVVDVVALHEQVRPADQVLEAADAEFGHDATGLFGHEEEVVDDGAGLAAEALPEFRILRGDADGTCVEVALAHHHAAFDDERRCRKAEFVRAEHGADDDVAPRLDLAVDLDRNAVAQAVDDERLLSFGETELPGAARVLHRRERACARAAVVPRNDDVVGLRLGDARGHRAHARFGDELHRDVGRAVGGLEVVDELREVLDRVDVVMRRRRDEADAGDGVPEFGDVFGHLVAGKLAAFARLGALGHLDLDLVRAREVLGRHAEARRGHLLDLRAQAVARLELHVRDNPVAAEHVGERLAGLDGREAGHHLGLIAPRILAALA